MSTHNAKQHGFSLLELLFIIAALALLAALSFPVLVRAQQPQNNAQQRDPNQTCMSNLKQIGLGIMQYTQDYDERFPVLEYQNPGTRQSISWRTNIQPYVKSTQIFRCPINPLNSYPATADADFNQQNSTTSFVLRPDVTPQLAPNGTLTNPAEDYMPIVVPAMAISYGASTVVMKRDAPIETAPGVWTSNMVNMADLENVASLIMVSESTRGDAELNFNAPIASFGRGEVLFAGHFAQMSCLFADGHVAMMRPSQTTAFWFNTPASNRDYDALARRLEAAELAFTPQQEENEPARAEQAATETKRETKSETPVEAPKAPETTNP